MRGPSDGELVEGVLSIVIGAEPMYVSWRKTIDIWNIFCSERAVNQLN